MGVNLYGVTAGADYTELRGGYAFVWNMNDGPIRAYTLEGLEVDQFAAGRTLEDCRDMIRRWLAGILADADRPTGPVCHACHLPIRAIDQAVYRGQDWHIWCLDLAKAGRKIAKLEGVGEEET